MMDLSHWDIVAFFSIREAAHLAAGTDPFLETQPPEVEAKVKLIARQMEHAYQFAFLSARNILNKPRDPEENYYTVFIGGELISQKLKWAVKSSLRNGAPLTDGDLEDIGAQVFGRREIFDWQSDVGLTSAYRFYEPKDTKTEVQVQEPHGGLEERPLHSRTRNTYLRLLHRLSVSAVPDFDPRKPYEAANKLLEFIDLEMDQKTVAGIVTDGARLYEMERGKHSS